MTPPDASHRVTTAGDGGPVLVKRATSTAGRARLAGEATLLRTVDHPSLVRVVDHRDDAGATELHLAWVGPHTLATVTSVPVAEAGLLVARVAEVVADLHRAGVVHRRLTPDHVLLGADGAPVLTGLAEAVGGHRADRTDDVAALGTLLTGLVGPGADPPVIPDRRHRRAPDPGLRAVLLTMADLATADDPESRPTAGGLADQVRRAVGPAPGRHRGRRRRDPSPGASRPVAAAIPSRPGGAEPPATPDAGRQGPDGRPGDQRPPVPPAPTPDAVGPARVGPRSVVLPPLRPPSGPPTIGADPGPGARPGPGTTPRGTSSPPAPAPTPVRGGHPEGVGPAAGLLRARRPAERATARRRSVRAVRRRWDEVPPGRRVAVAVVVLAILASLAAVRGFAAPDTPDAAARARPSTTAPRATAPDAARTAPGVTGPADLEVVPPPVAADPPGADGCTPVAAASAADVDGDGCPDAVRIDDERVTAGGTTWVVGRPGDTVAVADWDCDGTATVASLRPSTGEVFVFDRWAIAGDQLTVRAATTVPDAQALEAVDDDGDGCAVLTATRDGAPAVAVPRGDR